MHTRKDATCINEIVLGQEAFSNPRVRGTVQKVSFKNPVHSFETSALHIQLQVLGIDVSENYRKQRIRHCGALPDTEY